ncbi:MAG: hypothetical protein L6Q54_05550 [Leptospiraceae bacterium]|nr:hypothetical protein [Leptospiraceae bacterium]MCK6380703.1 hypothetical protein [Leptospiraceae bacterium]
MKLVYIFLLICLNQCTIDIKQVPAIRASNSPISKIDKVLFFGKFDIYTADRELFIKAWKYSFESIVKSHRIFKNVESLPEDFANLPTDYFIIDIDIRPKLESEYNWWWTWPAIYPFTAYWPFQKRTGKYSLEIEYKIFNQDGEEELTGKIIRNSEHTVDLYGFFRTWGIEKMIETVNLEAMEECAKILNSSF